MRFNKRCDLIIEQSSVYDPLQSKTVQQNRYYLQNAPCNISSIGAEKQVRLSDIDVNLVSNVVKLHGNHTQEIDFIEIGTDKYKVLKQLNKRHDTVFYCAEVVS